MEQLIQINPEKQRLPEWFKIRLPASETYFKVKQMIPGNTHTICEEGRCPNRSECWSRGTATFLLLGEFCTKNCLYCNVKTGKPLPPDLDEPKKVAGIVKKLGLKYVVLTSVTRDDLKDGGAFIFAETIREIKKLNPEIKVEVLTPEFRDSCEKSVDIIMEANPDVFAHNIETIPRLYPVVRKQGRYEYGIRILKMIKEKNYGMITKSSIILGMGETKEEVVNVMNDLRKLDVSIITMGQYLRPSHKHHPIAKFYHPDEFKEFEELSYEMGFKFAKCGPLVRSSYYAEHGLNASLH